MAFFGEREYIEMSSDMVFESCFIGILLLQQRLSIQSSCKLGFHPKSYTDLSVYVTADMRNRGFHVIPELTSDYKKLLSPSVNT